MHPPTQSLSKTAGKPSLGIPSTTLPVYLVPMDPLRPLAIRSAPSRPPKQPSELAPPKGREISASPNPDPPDRFSRLNSLQRPPTGKFPRAKVVNSARCTIDVRRPKSGFYAKVVPPQWIPIANNRQGSNGYRG